MGEYTAMDCLELGSSDVRTEKNPVSLKIWYARLQ